MPPRTAASESASEENGVGPSTDPDETTIDSGDSADTANQTTGGYERMGWSIWGEPDAEQESIGGSISGIPDLNRDGRGELVIGAPNRDGTAPDSGRVYIVFGKSDDSDVDLSDLRDGAVGVHIDAEAAGDHLGQCVSKAGDVDGDGMSDFVIGAPGADEGKGRAYVVFGGTTMPESVASLAENGKGFAIHAQRSPELSTRTGGNGGLGYGVHAAGDVNADGYADVLVTARDVELQSTNGAIEKVAYVVLGGPGRSDVELDDVAANVGGFVVLGGVPVGEDELRYGVGDFNGDGFDDLALRSAGVSVFFGRESVTTLEASDVDIVVFGADLTPFAPIGDFNGDGLGDVIVSDWVGDATFQAAYIVYGRSDPAPTIDAMNDLFPDGLLVETLDNGHEGFAPFADVVLKLGDIDGDGLDDVALHARIKGGFASNVDPAWWGASGWFVIRGVAEGTGISATDLLAPEASDVGFFLPHEAVVEPACFRPAGDLDGDGRAEIVLSAREASPSGRIDIFLASHLP